MSAPADLIEAYVKAASAVGVQVELQPEGVSAARLGALLRELGATAVAVPARGWPEGLGEALQAAIQEAGCTVVRPKEGNSGFLWDREALAGAELGITWAPAFLADTGSLVLPAGAGFGTLASLLPPVHLALSAASCVLPDLGSYLGALSKLPSRLTLVTGPSRTGDIEGTLTPGVHGPGRVLHWIFPG